MREKERKSLVPPKRDLGEQNEAGFTDKGRVDPFCAAQRRR